MDNKNYDEQMGISMQNVLSLHNNCQKLLSDMDEIFPEYMKSRFKNTITRDFSRSIASDVWMAPGLFRYWIGKNYITAGVNIYFYGEEDVKEPFITFARIDYKYETSCEHLDIRDHLVFREDEDERDKIKIKYDDVVEMSFHGKKHESYEIKSFSYINCRLSDVKNIEYVKEMFKKVGILNLKK